MGGAFFDGEEHGSIGTNLEDGHLAELSAFTFFSFLSEDKGLGQKIFYELSDTNT